MNGRELMAQAHRHRPELKVLFMTGYSRNAIVHQGRLDPGIEMIQKPMSQRELAGRIRDLLDASPPGKTPPRRRRRTRNERYSMSDIGAPYIGRSLRRREDRRLLTGR